MTVSGDAVEKSTERELMAICDIVMEFEVGMRGSDFDTRMVIRRFRNSPENLAFITFRVTPEEPLPQRLSNEWHNSPNLQVTRPLVRVMKSASDYREAVSPVIATVLLLAITVLLTSGIYIMVQDAVQAPDKGTPYGQLTSQSLENGFQVVRVSDLSNELMINTIKFQIISNNGTIIEGLANDASVYGAIGSDVTFQDRDAGLTLNRGIISLSMQQQ